ncbi:hypothetical protein ABVK25_004841 [Lepraria finkii]|uniref:Uncharacterized protein n=1 Tax=Lepraria finkii TaxID=1340010 RepID=A0ABR4BAY3_9LECA
MKELEAANRTLKNDKEVMADDENSLSQRLDQIEHQTTRWNKHYSMSAKLMPAASKEDAENHGKVQAEVMKIKEHLLEAEEDKQSLAKEMEKLKVEHASMLGQISTGTKGISVMAKEFEDLMTENTSLEDKVKGL